MTATKQQERLALEQIRNTIAALGFGSYVGTALNGVLSYAEQNIEYDSAFTAPASLMQPTRHNGYASNVSETDYAKLEKAGEEMTDAEAKILVNDEFGFEVSRIKILREAEIDTTEPGAKRLTHRKVPRKPIYCATDWNYIRFDVHGCTATWQYEMINAQLYEVNT
jgi:hypothetical protein